MTTRAISEWSLNPTQPNPLQEIDYSKKKKHNRFELKTVVGSPVFCSIVNSYYFKILFPMRKVETTQWWLYLSRKVSYQELSYKQLNHKKIN